MKISIPQPCHENWNEMLPEEKGRFCLSCQKCVLDFTQLSDEEIITNIPKSNQCGRFSNQQLERINQRLKEKNQIHLPRIFRYSAFIAGLGLSGSIVAQEKEKIEIIDNNIIDIPNLISDSILLKKQVIDIYGIPLSDVSVQLKNSKLEAFTDEDGFFELLIPKNEETIIAITDYMGDHQEFKLLEIKEKEIIFDTKEIELFRVGGIIFERSFTGKIFHTLSWPFRQIGKLF